MLAATARRRITPTRRAVAVQPQAVSSTRPLPTVGRIPRPSAARVLLPAATRVAARTFSSTARTGKDDGAAAVAKRRPEDEEGAEDAIPAEELTSVGAHEKEHEHAVISAFDLFSIGGARTRLGTGQEG